jgi:hypothetical protein
MVSNVPDNNPAFKKPLLSVGDITLFSIDIAPASLINDAEKIKIEAIKNSDTGIVSSY